MTVSEFLSVVNCDSISIVNNGNLVPIEKDNELDMSAYGDFIVEKADFSATQNVAFCEITLKCTYLRKGA